MLNVSGKTINVTKAEDVSLHFLSNVFFFSRFLKKKKSSDCSTTSFYDRNHFNNSGSSAQKEKITQVSSVQTNCRSAGYCCAAQVGGSSFEDNREVFDDSEK